MDAAGDVRIEHHAADGTVTVLKEKLSLLEGEVIDASCMSVKALEAFYEEQFTKCKEEGILLSLHLKATMMKAPHHHCSALSRVSVWRRVHQVGGDDGRSRTRSCLGMRSRSSSRTCSPSMVRSSLSSGCQPTPHEHV